MQLLLLVNLKRNTSLWANAPGIRGVRTRCVEKSEVKFPRKRPLTISPHEQALIKVDPWYQRVKRRPDRLFVLLLWETNLRPSNRSEKRKHRHRDSILIRYPLPNSHKMYRGDVPKITNKSQQIRMSTRRQRVTSAQGKKSNKFSCCWNRHLSKVSQNQFHRKEVARNHAQEVSAAKPSMQQLARTLGRANQIAGKAQRGSCAWRIDSSLRLRRNSVR